MNILEEFWYGNIEPAEFDTSPSPEHREILLLISRNEDKLLATMTSAIGRNCTTEAATTPPLDIVPYLRHHRKPLMPNMAADIRSTKPQPIPARNKVSTSP